MLLSVSNSNFNDLQKKNYEEQLKNNIILVEFRYTLYNYNFIGDRPLFLLAIFFTWTYDYLDIILYEFILNTLICSAIYFILTSIYNLLLMRILS